MLLLAAGSGPVLASCSSFEIPRWTGANPFFRPPSLTSASVQPSIAETYGNGPVRVALLLPLSDPGLGSLARTMANGSRLAVDFIAANPNIADNITIVLKDSGTSPQMAAERTAEAVSEGARLILGPLRSEDVISAGAAARAGGVPMIAFSNNKAAAGPGVYLLNILPQTEIRRSLAYARGQGRHSFAGIFPTSPYGSAQQSAFEQVLADLVLGASATYNFSSEAEARDIVRQVAPLVANGSVDALFLPDRATASSFGVLLEQAGVERSRLALLGSADWDGDQNILQTAFLNGALYPAVDDTGYLALRAEYQSRFGGEPHPLTSIVYTATILSNVSSLSMASPPYPVSQLTSPAGFNGRDGVFRFLPDGRSEHALVMKQVRHGGAQKVDGPRL